MKSSQLSQIWIYPVKSLGGISVPEALVLAKGLELDRRWMLVDETGGFISQRRLPSMALFKLTLSSQKLTVTHKQNTLDILTGQSFGAPIEANVWGDTVTVLEVSPGHSRWFSERIGFPCRLVFFPEENPRRVDPSYSIDDNHTSLSDGFPFLIIGQSSLDDLNRRLEQPVPINRFRPNLVFTGGEPFEEDTWRNFAIGENRFAGVKPCSRCIMTTVNHETGETGTEPLKTLSTYRKRNNNVYFGQNAISIDTGHIRVGDLIRVESVIPV